MSMNPHDPNDPNAEVPLVQDLSKFKVPAGFRGRSAFYVQFWWIVQSSLFRLSPQFAYRYRAMLLRLFGAKVGSNTIIRPSVTITYPWKITLGDNCWIGDDAVLYSLGNITIGKNAVVSQKSYLCAADHDYRKIDFEIRSRSINIGPESWIATDVFVGPGVNVGARSVVGARSSVFRDIPDDVVAAGTPCRILGRRSGLMDTEADVSRSTSNK